MFLIGKLKTYLLIVASLLFPFLYILGRKDGKKIVENDIIKEDLEAEKIVSNFYKAMADDAEETTPTTRSDLTERLRRDGL